MPLVSTVLGLDSGLCRNSAPARNIHTHEYIHCKTIKFIHSNNGMLNGTILNAALKIVSCDMAGYTIINAMLSYGNKLHIFENNSKPHSIVGRILLELIRVMPIVVDFLE